MKQKYEYNRNFFCCDTPETFYWAGFIAADGNISHKGDFTLSLKLVDNDHLLKFKEQTQSQAPIKILPPKNKIIAGVKTRTSGTSIIRFRARDWILPLQKFGIVPNKTKTYCIPNEIISDKNFKHFIRGYFDGDGWFSIKNGAKKQRLCFGLCGNLSVLQSVQYYLQKQCQIESLPSIYKQKSIFKFEFQNQHDIYKIVDLLYQNTKTHLNRKYEIAKLAKQFDDNTIILNLPADKLLESYHRLKSYKLMAQEFNCAKSTIAKYMKKYNLSGVL